MVRVVILFVACMLLVGCSEGAAEATNIPFRPKKRTREDILQARIPTIHCTGEHYTGDTEYLSVSQIEESGVQLFRVYDIPRRVDANFAGVLLRDFVGKWAPKAKRVVFGSIDGSKVVVVAAEWRKVDFVIATREGEHYLTRAEKGPVRVIVGKSKDSSSKDSSVVRLDSKWIGQVTEIHFE